MYLYWVLLLIFTVIRLWSFQFEITLKRQQMLNIQCVICFRIAVNGCLLKLESFNTNHADNSNNSMFPYSVVVLSDSNILCNINSNSVKGILAVEKRTRRFPKSVVYFMTTCIYLRWKLSSSACSTQHNYDFNVSN